LRTETWGPSSDRAFEEARRSGTSRRAASSWKEIPKVSVTTAPSGPEIENGVLGVDPVDAGEPGQWVGALGHQLGRPVFGEEGHHHQHLLCVRAMHARTSVRVKSRRVVYDA